MKRLLLLGLLVGGLIFSLTGCSLFNQGPDIQNWQPSVKPGGNEIVFSSKDGKDFELYVMNPETGERTKITDNKSDDWGPDWGPEGERLVFVSQRNDNTDIYVIDANGGNEKRLTENKSQDVNPRWNGSSDVVFNSDRTDSWQIFSVSLPEKDLTQITRSKSKEE